jgi:DNA-binding transcriptional MocR family regulator
MMVVMNSSSAPAAAVGRLVRDVRGLSSREVVELIAARVAAGDLPAGTQLPTIREFAASTGLGTSSVAKVWTSLVERGLVQTRRRGGTVVRPPAVTWPRAAEPRVFDGWAGVDLNTAHPGPDQLPDLHAALHRSLLEPETNSLQREPITELLRRACEADWPFAAQDWAAVGGAAEAMLLTTEAATEPKGLVALEQPTTSGTIGNFRTLGYRILGVDADEHGPVPGSLADALRQGARTFVYQPAGTFTVHSMLTPQRLTELADVLSEYPDAWVLEEDILGPLNGAPPLSLGDVLPGRVVRLTSYCRAFGLDLRTTVLGGSRELIERVRRLRSHGILAQSRILQNAMAHLLLDADARAFVAAAAAGFAAKAEALTGALRRLDVAAATPPGGLVVWVPAENEDETLAELASRGVVLAPSSRTFVTPPDPALIRVATPQLPEDPALVSELARMLTATSRAALLAG